MDMFGRSIIYNIKVYIGILYILGYLAGDTVYPRIFGGDTIYRSARNNCAIQTNAKNASGCTIALLNFASH